MINNDDLNELLKAATKQVAATPTIKKENKTLKHICGLWNSLRDLIGGAIFEDHGKSTPPQSMHIPLHELEMELPIGCNIYHDPFESNDKTVVAETPEANFDGMLTIDSTKPLYCNLVINGDNLSEHQLYIPKPWQIREIGGKEYQCITFGLFEQVYAIASYVAKDGSRYMSSLHAIISGDTESAYTIAATELHYKLSVLAPFKIE